MIVYPDMHKGEYIDDVEDSIKLNKEAANILFRI
jgi:hypothetical protein